MRYFLGALIGVAIGGVGFSILVVLLTAIFAAPALGDGQYGIVFIFTLPLGGLLGATIAVTALALSNRW